MSVTNPIFFDESGNPVLMAADRFRKRIIDNREPANLITPDATSGPAEWGRYHDAVREAARSFDAPQEGDIHHFLQARAKKPEQVDVPAFHEAVKRQRMADLVDIVDHHMRRDGSLPRGSRTVRTQAPRGYMRRALRQLPPEDLAHLHHRLISIGHKHEHVADYLKSRVKPDIWDQATVYEIRASDEEFAGLEFDDSDDGWDGLNPNSLRDVEQMVINVYLDGKKLTTEVGDTE